MIEDKQFSNMLVIMGIATMLLFAIGILTNMKATKESFMINGKHMSRKKIQNMLVNGIHGFNKNLPRISEKLNSIVNDKNKLNSLSNKIYDVNESMTNGFIRLDELKTYLNKILTIDDTENHSDDDQQIDVKSSSSRSTSSVATQKAKNVISSGNDLIIT